MGSASVRLALGFAAPLPDRMRWPCDCEPAHMPARGVFLLLRSLYVRLQYCSILYA
ncbi:hypothetical protein PAHAL_1G382300 [Panicum hallii]|uniref:Uncharacterized protein n=1 Tax=Panicum hallii TaxID=206008 RepID=A0A2T8KXK9_9POAL|nr:hypothetical protein PAHAL_1G382300 [Panicum hallii]